MAKGEFHEEARVYLDSPETAPERFLKNRNPVIVDVQLDGLVVHLVIHLLALLYPVAKVQIV